MNKPKADSTAGIKIRRPLAGFAVFARWLGLRFSKRSFLRNAGFFDSVRYRAPCRPDGSPLPWMNYAMIAFLEERLNGGLSVFEYGSGNSTLFLANRVDRVVSVERDSEWHAYVADLMPANVELILCQPFSREAYLDVIRQKAQKFDIVIVDAHEREACLLDSINWLTSSGVVILDDVKDEAYRDSTATLAGKGFKRLVFEGLKPGGFSLYRTAVFYRAENVMGI